MHVLIKGIVSFRFWKQLTVRVNLNGDIMCIIQISPSQDMEEVMSCIAFYTV